MSAQERLAALMSRATASAEWRGHTLDWGSAEVSATLQRLAGSASRMQRLGVCIHCGADVGVDTLPPPNGIDVGGTAVALDCGVDE